LSHNASEGDKKPRSETALQFIKLTKDSQNENKLPPTAQQFRRISPSSPGFNSSFGSLTHKPKTPTSSIFFDLDANFQSARHKK
jgi:hypothetical protein